MFNLYKRLDLHAQKKYYPTFIFKLTLKYNPYSGGKLTICPNLPCFGKPTLPGFLDVVWTEVHSKGLLQISSAQLVFFMGFLYKTWNSQSFWLSTHCEDTMLI